MEEHPRPNNEALQLRGRQQIEIALGALAFANVESSVTQILSAILAAHEMTIENCKSNGVGSTISITLAGEDGMGMREQVMMSLDIVLVSDAASEEQKIAAHELRRILAEE